MPLLGCSSEEIVLLLFLTILCMLKTDAAVIGWTNPVISGASGSGAATPSVPEDTPAGTTTNVIINATVAGNAWYAIFSQTTAGKLTIDSGTGLLSLAGNKSFDFETEPTYEMVITCKDDSDNATGTATVTLNIANANEAPTFAKSQYTAVIKDGATAGTALLTVTATDVDASDTITYSITGGDTNNHWTTGSSTGAITVKSGVTLAQSTTGGYSLTITATDSGSLIGTTTVWVAVATCSDGMKAIASGLLMFVSCIVALL